jgi:hypothetical protein
MTRMCRLSPFAFVALLTLAATAQTPTFTPLLTGQRVVTMQYAAGAVYAGLPKGGVVRWDPATGEATDAWTRADGLGGHYVSDLAWSGRRLWVATEDGGLTSVTDPGGAGQLLRTYSSLLSSLEITAVDGLVVGDNERLYYGTDGAGIGIIVDGLPGAYYSTQNGLIDDTVDDLAYDGSILLVATPSGVSRLAANTFTSYPYADSDAERIAALALGPDGRIWAAAEDGLKIWNDETRAWELRNGSRFLDLASGGEVLWALASSAIIRVEGASLLSLPLPVGPDGTVAETAAVAASTEESWLGGRLRLSAPPVGQQATQAWVGSSSDGQNGVPPRPLDTCTLGVAGGFDAAAVDARGRAWLGDREGDGLAALDAGAWYNVTQVATAANDSNGLFNNQGGLLAMARDGDALWFNQFTMGAVRFTPAAEPGGAEDWLLLRPENSPMLGDCFINIAAHPDGVILFGTDATTWSGTDNSQLGVDILVDQSRPFDPASWMHIGPDILGGNVIGAIGFERRDVVWFAVRNVGLRRWDINGLGAGENAPLTWLDTSDDHWPDDPLPAVPGSSLELDAANAIAAGPAGTMFAGGSGLVQFRYEPVLDLATRVGQWEQKTLAAVPGLLSQIVVGLASDRNGAIWALTGAGLNRLRFLEDTVAVDAFTDLANFLTFDPSFYSPGVIAPLPGGTYRRLDVSADGRRLVLSSDLGGVMLDVPEAGSGGGDAVPLQDAYLYPNPFPGDGTASHVSVGGLDIDDESPITVQVLNLAGQIVFRSRSLDAGEQVWDGRTLEGNRVASGLYVVRISQGGATVVRTLAITF